MDVNLAEFLGIHHTEAVTPAYIFDGHLQSLLQFNTEAKGLNNHLPRLFREIAEGVHYLHSKGMVHMELKSSTVTVSKNFNTFICDNMCIFYYLKSFDSFDSVYRSVYIHILVDMIYNKRFVQIVYITEYYFFQGTKVCFYSRYLWNISVVT